MNTHPFYLHIEGMDLAGKSSVCRRFGQGAGQPLLLRRNALSGDNPIFDLADRLRREDAFGTATLGHLFAAALMADLERFEWPIRPALQDSTVLLRSLAFHTVAGTPHLRDILEALLAKHPRFDASFVLTASHARRLERLEARRIAAPDEIAADDLLVVRQPALFFAMEDCLIDLAQRHFGATVIDTSDRSIEDVVSAITCALPGSSLR